MDATTTIAVLGGGTGAGATTLLVALATRAAAAGRRVAVVDADSWGGGVDLAFGIESEPGVRWEDLLGSDGPLDGARLAERLPRCGGVPVLSFGRQWCELPRELLDRAVAGLRDASDLLLVDLGRRGGRSAAAYDELLLVAHGTACGLAAAGATAQRLDQEPRLVVRGCDTAVAREAADVLGLALAGVLPTDRHLPVDTERGVAAGSRKRSAYATRCDELLRDLLLADEVAA